MTNQTTSDDLFASKFLTGHTIFPDDQRIFHRPGFEYDDICRMVDTAFSSSHLTAGITYRSGEPGEVSIEPAGERVVRIRIAPRGAIFEQNSPMLMPFPEDLPPAECTTDDQKITYFFQKYRIEITRMPFHIRVIDPGGEMIFESETERLVGRFTAPPVGIRRRVTPPDARNTILSEDLGQSNDSMDADGAFFSWRIRNQDRSFGLGKKFSRLEKTGTRATIWQADTCGSNTTDMSYKAVPAIFCTAGWGLLLHSSFRSYWEIGSFSYATGSLLVEEPRLDLFLILAPSLKEQIIAYTALTGRPSLPPAVGFWDLDEQIGLQ